MKKPSLYQMLLLILFGLFAFLLSVDLGDSYLWIDEAETAVLARSTATFGYPRAWDGQNIVTQQNGRDFTENFTWRWHPWLPMYIAAPFVKFLGPSTISARLPFVILAFFTGVLFYLYSLRLFQGNRHKSFISTTIFLLSVEFLLYSQQIRYFSPVFFGAILAALGYEYLNRWWGTLLFFSGLLVLVLSNPIPYVAMVGSFIFLSLILRERRHRFALILPSVIFTGLVLLSWMKLTGFTSLTSTGGRYTSVVSEMTTQFLLDFNLFVSPIVVGALLTLLFLRNKEKRSYLFFPFVLLFLSIAITIYKAPTKTPHLRYILVSMPFFAIIYTEFISRVGKRFRTLSFILLFSFILTNVWNILPHHVLKHFLPLIEDRIQKSEALGLVGVAVYNNLNIRSYLWEYIKATKYPYVGPLEGFLTSPTFKERCSQDSLLVSDFNPEGIAYYTNLPVANRLKRDRICYTLPEHIYEAPSSVDCILSLSGTWPLIGLSFKDYSTVPLDNIPQYRFENRPNLRLHRYKSEVGEVEDVPKIFVKNQ